MVFLYYIVSSHTLDEFFVYISAVGSDKIGTPALTIHTEVVNSTMAKTSKAYSENEAPVKSPKRIGHLYFFQENKAYQDI